MVIIEEDADNQLIEVLKKPIDQLGKYCIRFYPAIGNLPEARKHITTLAQKHLPLSHLYFCNGGEIFLMSAEASVWECRKLMQEIGAELGIALVERVGELYDLSRESGLLQIVLESKRKDVRGVDEAALKRQQAEQKRERILGQGASSSAQQIADRRGHHREPVVMIIEDDPFSRKLVQNLLQKQCHLTGLATADNALATYVDLAPDMLLLDINLPDVTGHELLEKIIALDPKAYVVMLSGNADRNNIMQAMGHGAAGFVAKPFSREKLFQYIERCPTISKEKIQ